MNENKTIIAIVVSTVLLLVGIVFLATKMSNAAKVDASSDAKAVVKSNKYDWGEIGINNGVVEANFEIVNEGENTLKLYNVTTSCACTTARLITAKATSPVFGMHTKSGYVMDVEPGDKATLKVIFDPLFHGPNGLGPISRTITVTSNDASNPTLTFDLSAQVIK